MTSSVLLLLFLSCLSGSSLRAQTPKGDWSAIELQVREKVKRGMDVVFDEGQPGALSGTFLAELIETYVPPSNHPSRGILIKNARVTGPFSLSEMTISYWLKLEDCYFDGNVDFSESNFEKSLSLRGGHFLGTANFYQITVAGNLRVNKAQFRSKDRQINFDSIRVGGTFFFYESVLEGPFTLNGSSMNELECTGTQFTNNDVQYRDNDDEMQSIEANADFYNIKVNGNANFAHTSYQGLATFESANIAGQLELTDAHFNDDRKTMTFGNMKVGGNAVFNYAVFAGGFDLSRIVVGGTLEFYQTQAPHPKSVKTFSGMKVDTANFEQAALAPPYSLEDADYRVFSSQKALDFIEESQNYSPGTFANLESYFRRIGLEKAANTVYIEGKKKESCREGWLGYISNWFLYLTVGYGKRPWLALLWSAGIIVIGWRRFFRYEKDMTTKNPEDKSRYAERYNPLWYSIALFLPIVDLEDAKIWTVGPDRRWARHYMRLHVLLGYLLIPIGLAAWTGLIK